MLLIWSSCSLFWFLGLVTNGHDGCCFAIALYYQLLPTYFFVFGALVDSCVENQCTRFKDKKTNGHDGSSLFEADTH